MGLLLEAFDEAAPPEAEVPSGPSAEWLEGHAAGFAEGLAEGTAEAEARAEALSAELAQTLADTAFGFAEARGHILGALRPLFRLVIERLLPATAAEALAPWLAETLLEAARADTACPLLIAVHPSRVAAVAACLPVGAAGPAQVLGDPTLGPNAARLLDRGVETSLDLDACVAGLSEALSAIFDPSTRKASHG